ncbi:Vacuolar calcium ion transporter [Madurella fahalii]|uniref:Vacuolar calcium ion transporter n=1 Tax=Madurella fahalii TaxID=1157608 RepID=A0ABQ0GM06_9PEZI
MASNVNHGQPTRPTSRQQPQPPSTPPLPSGTTSSSATPDKEKAPSPRQTPVAANNGLPLHTGDLPLQKQLTPAEMIVRSLRVQPTGESGRSGVHPYHFLRILFRSSSWASRIVNVLWPVVPAAIAVRYATPSNHLVIFILSYLAMVPCANMIGFAGQELGRKLPHVLGVLMETTLGSLVEIIMFIVLITRPAVSGIDYIQVIQAAILGSVLATMLLCLGLCFFAAGLKREETTFSETVSEAGSGLLLTAGFGLAIPTVYEHSLSGSGKLTEADLMDRTIEISRSTAVLLMIAYLIYIFFQARTHHGIYDAVFIEDTKRDTDRHNDRMHHRLTFTECCIALAISVALVTIIAIALVDQIHFLVEERHVSDAFVGLILVPLVEKAAEHLTAVDEAYDNQMNFALSHVLGATLQTALFNAPLVVLVGWGLDKPMGLNFEVFDLAVLLLAIITVGNFLRDQKSNYLEGALCVIVYIAIAVAALYYPNPHHAAGGTEYH